MQDDRRDDDLALSFSDWCKERGISESTGHRLRKAGKAPKFFRISDRRIATTRGEDRRWRNSLPTA